MRFGDRLFMQIYMSIMGSGRGRKMAVLIWSCHRKISKGDDVGKEYTLLDHGNETSVL